MMTPNTRIATSALSLAILLGFTSLAPSLQAQDPKKKPDPEVAEKIEKFEDAATDPRFEHDQEAISLLGELWPKYEEMHTKNQQALIKALSKVFQGRTRKPDQALIYIECAGALGEIGGKDASRILVKAYEDNDFKDREDWGTLQDKLLESIGQTKDPKQVKMLLDEAQRSHEDGIKAAAGKALRHFSGAAFKVRKEIVGELVKAYDNVYNGAHKSLNQDPQVDRDKRTLRAIADPWNETLFQLTGDKLSLATEWRSWWNDHKNSPKKWKNQSDGKSS